MTIAGMSVPGATASMNALQPPAAGTQLVLASHNAGKLKELQQLVAGVGLQVLSAAELGLAEPVEDGDTFHANAALKARAAATTSGLLSLSDDSGLVVPALGGAPGIYSARWAGPSKDFAAASARIADELTAAGHTPHGTPAYFVCVIALADATGACEYFEGRAEGTLCFPARGAEGFGYDPIFVPHGCSQSFAEMPLDEKQRISHRAKAFAAFCHWLSR